MTDLTFVTGNTDKFKIAAELFQDANLSLQQADLEIDEIQSEDVETIARQKAAEAYRLLQRPLIVRDDSWALPGLRGFPGPYMKSMNHWLTPEDFLRLTGSLEDRRAFLTQTLVYQDAKQQKVLTHVTEARLLPSINGKAGAPFERIASIQGDDGKSIAEVMESGAAHSNRAPAKVWHEFIAWYKETIA